MWDGDYATKPTPLQKLFVVLSPRVGWRLVYFLIFQQIKDILVLSPPRGIATGDQKLLQPHNNGSKPTVWDGDSVNDLQRYIISFLLRSEPTAWDGDAYGFLREINSLKSQVLSPLCGMVTLTCIVIAVSVYPSSEPTVWDDGY